MLGENRQVPAVCRFRSWTYLFEQQALLTACRLVAEMPNTTYTCVYIYMYIYCDDRKELMTLSPVAMTMTAQVVVDVRFCVAMILIVAAVDEIVDAGSHGRRHNDFVFGSSPNY